MLSIDHHREMSHMNCDSKCDLKHSEKCPEEECNEETCMICFGKFTKKKPGIKLPCMYKCNTAPVHAKCIYLWQETKFGESTDKSSCPLCRRPMVPIDYTPPDPLNTLSLVMFQCRRNLVIRPLPKSAGIVKMYIRKTSSHYELYLQPNPREALLPRADPFPNDIFLLAAKRHTGLLDTNSTLDITLDKRCKDLDPKGVQLVGVVKSSMLGLSHTVYAPYLSLSTGRSTSSYREVASVRYVQNRIGRNVGPRKMEVCFPRIERDSEKPEQINESEFSDDDDDDDDEMCSWSTSMYKPTTFSETLAQRLKYHKLGEDVCFSYNKQPYWLETIQAFSLDFQGRVTLPSNKNFQLVSNTNPVINEQTTRLVEDLLLQFGKVIDSKVEVYTLDVKWPLSPVQAFGIAISACERKLACA